MQQDTTPIGLCFEWAYKYVRAHPDAKLMHATVTHPWSGARYFHAWIEQGDIIRDWQREVLRGEGPLGIRQFYALYRPTDVQRYTREQATVNAVRSRHYGPW